jgi:predicted AAA+ superfamily ATPase
MFVKRDISKKILSGAKQVPVIAITGPRQSGKSTLAQELFKKHHYLDMQDVDLFDFARTDPKGFLQNYANDHGIIIDEAQYVPGLFPQIKVEADKNPQPGYYILSGSQNFLLHEKISESLAGRAYFYHLLPFSIHELEQSNLLIHRIDNLIFKGFYPRVYQSHIKFHDYYQNYISTYVERDIRLIKNIDNVLAFQKFMQLCAVRVGTTISFTDLATSCGINVATVKSWLSLLQTSFILFLLPPYHNNLGKRITKSPKLYFYDVGFAAELMGISKESLLQKRDLYGALFENMMIVDIIKNYNTLDASYTATFFRDSNQHEIDLILESVGKVIPIEIKSSEVIQKTFFDTARWFADQVSDAESPLVIYGGKETQRRSLGTALPWTNTRKITTMIK